jgi:hypothetical protein
MLVYAVALLLVSVRLALYPAAALFLFSLAIYVRQPLLKALLCFAAPAPLVRLLCNEEFIFILRGTAAAGATIDNFGISLMYAVGVTMLLLIWLLPLPYIFGYAVQNTAFLQRIGVSFRKPLSGLLILGIVIGYGAYLRSLPSYNDMWRPDIRVSANYQMPKGEATLKLIGNEYFKDVRVSADSLNREYAGRRHVETLPLEFEADWLSVNGEQRISSGELDTLFVDWEIVSRRPMYFTTLTVRADTSSISEVTTALNYSHRGSRLTFSWRDDPPQRLPVSFRCSVFPRAKIIRSITARYAEPPLPIEVTSDLGFVFYQTTVVYTDTLDMVINADALR